MKKTNRIILTARTDETFGGTGLHIEGMPHDDHTNPATDGILLAHDIVEHMNGPGEIGAIADELEALGAIWYVRGRHGELRRDSVGSMHSIEQNIAADVTRMFTDFFHGAYVPLKVPRTLACDADDAFREIIRIAVEDAPAELGEIDTYADADGVSDKLAQYTAVCLPLMRIGYRKAVRKYEKHGRFFANNLFWAIADAVRPRCEGLEPGYQFELVYGINNHDRAFAHCNEYWEE